jgi:hypothetical protein
MPDAPKAPTIQGENQLRTKYFREWKGVYTKSNRVAIPEDHFYDLTNLIPIGASNIHTIGGLSSSLVSYGANTIYWLQYININSTGYIIAFDINGNVYAYNIATQTNTLINSGTPLSGANSRMDQWKNSALLIADTTGYYSWDGTTFTGPLTGGTPLATVTSATTSGSTGTLRFATNANLLSGASVILTGFTPSGWNGVYNVTIPTLPAITSMTFSGTAATMVFSSAHGLLTNDIITLTGFTPIGWDGTFTVTVTNSTTITFTLAATPVPPILPTISSITSSGLVTFSGGHGLQTGNLLILSGFTPAGLNATWVVTFVSVTQVSIAWSGLAASVIGTAYGEIVGQAAVNNVAKITFTGTPPATATVIGTAQNGGVLPYGTLTSPDVAVFSNRVWVYSNRALYVSAINSYTDFTITDGAVIQNLTDPQLRGQATRIYSANGYLYILGTSSIFVISDVYIPSGAVPPAPVFSVLNVQAIIGCDQPGSVFTFDRNLMFANTYGLWVMSGVTAQRLSEDIDGTIQYLDTTFPISGGTSKVENILNSGFLIKQKNDPVFGTRTIVAMNFDNKWWFANYGNLTFVTSAISNNQPVMFGLLNNNLYQLFYDEVNSPYSSWTGPLWPMEDQLSDKEVFRAGFEMTITSVNAVTATIDTPNTSIQFYPPSYNPNGNVGVIQWVNNSGATVTWQNNFLATVNWFTGSYLLYVGDGLGAYAKYVGMSGYASAGSVYELNSNIMDYALRKRW